MTSTPSVLQESGQGLLPRAGSIGKFPAPMHHREQRFVFLQARQAFQVLPGEPGDFFLTLIINIGKTGQVKGAQVQDPPVFQAGNAFLGQAPAHFPVGVLSQVQAVIVGQAHRPDVEAL